jgi:hypothetical protein
MRHIRSIAPIAGLLLTTTLPIWAAQGQAQSQDWQGPRSGQEEVIPSPQVLPVPVPQLVVPGTPQHTGEGHPQTMEVPASQASPVLPKQPHLLPSQPPPDLAAQLPPQLPPQSGPVYLGLDGKTAPVCRYPAGVRVTQTVAGSPADQAGLSGETKLTWKNAAIGLLSSPLLMPLMSSETEYTGTVSDLILAVDGQRIRDTGEFKKEMSRFRPGDLVYFSILRDEGKLRQIPVRLQGYPNNLLHQHTNEAFAAAQKRLGKSIETMARKELENIVGPEFSDIVGDGIETVNKYDLDTLARGDVESFVRKEVETQVKKKLRNRVGKELEPYLDRELQSRFRKGLETLETEDFQALVQNEIENRVERELENRLEQELDTRLRQEIDPVAMQKMQDRLLREVEAHERKQRQLR